MTLESQVQKEAESSRKSNQKSKIIPREYIKSFQIRHFLLYNVLPFIGFIIAIISLWWFPIGSIEIGLLIGMWALTMIGMSVGLHRYFAHRAFKTNQIIRAILGVLGCMGAQGTIVSWVVVHRRHHECSDHIGDPHSPNPELLKEGVFRKWRGFWHGHLGWLTNHDYPSPVSYAPELLKDKMITKIDKYYVVWILLGLLIPTMLGGILHSSWMGAYQGFLWGGCVRMVLVDNCILSITSFSHLYGTQPFKANDNSRNNLWLIIPTFGESFQNNHHAFERSALFSKKWWQVDLGYSFIWILEKLGLVWEVNQPTLKMIEAKRQA